MSLRYKVVELGTVTDEEIEKALNQWTAEGWTFDTMQFAMRDASKRPIHGLRDLHARRSRLSAPHAACAGIAA